MKRENYEFVETDYPGGATIFVARNGDDDMIEIEENIYEELAEGFLDRLGEASFFTGSLRHDTGAFQTSLTATVITYREEYARGSQRVTRLVPVWWDFSTTLDGVRKSNDFCFDRFSSNVVTLSASQEE